VIFTRSKATKRSGFAKVVSVVFTLGVAQNTGIDLGAHFSGVRGAGNCDDRVEAQVLTNAAARMPEFLSTASRQQI